MLVMKAKFQDDFSKFDLMFKIAYYDEGRFPHAPILLRSSDF